MTRKRNIIKEINPPLYVLVSTLFSYILLTAFALFSAAIGNLTDDPSALAGVLSFVSLLLTAAVGSFIISRLRGEGGFICALLAAALFVVVRIVISLFLSGTDISDLLDYASYLGVAAVFALLAQRKMRRKRR